MMTAAQIDVILRDIYLNPENSGAYGGANALDRQVIGVLKEIGTINVFTAFTMYTMGYYTSFNHQLLQNAVLYPKNGVRSVNLLIPVKISKLMSYGSRGVDASDTTIGLSNFSANQR